MFNLLWYLIIQNKRELYQANGKIKKKGEFEETRSKLKEVENGAKDNKSYSDDLENIDLNNVNKLIEENNIGLTIFISTDNHLKLILTFPCKQCGCHDLNLKKWKVKTWDLYLNITIFCEQCKYIEEFTNEPDAV